MHWMLLDRLPCHGDLEELLKLREKEPLPLPLFTSGGEHLPRSLSAIVEKCLQARPSKRFQSCAELETALKTIDPEDGKPADVFSESTVPMAKLAVIGAKQPKPADTSTAPGKTPVGQLPPLVQPQAPAQPAPSPMSPPGSPRKAAAPAAAPPAQAAKRSKARTRRRSTR